jgi:uncharacterized membrane protein YozB (DUF420 family)
MRAPFSTVVAAVTGAIILLGYFFPFEPLLQVQQTLLQWAIILAGFALLVGVVNLLGVHWTKIKRNKPGGFYSMIVIVSLVVTAMVGLVFTPTGDWSLWLFNSVHLPVEISLFALLSIFFIYAGVRLLRRRFNTLSVVFILTAVVVLLGTAPLFFMEDFAALTTARDFLVQVFALGGGRGILLGVALGTIVTGVRILIGSERPYSG